MDRLTKQFFSRPNHGTLSTSSLEGAVNAAVFGSMTRMPDDQLRLGLANGRTLKNLRENPQCVFLFSEPGDTLLQWKGRRLYLKAVAFETEGPQFEQAIVQITELAGEMAAEQVRTVVFFELQETRPLLAMGN